MYRGMQVELLSVGTALLDAIKAGHVDAVLVWHVDRLYRRTVDAGALSDIVVVQ